MPAALVMMMVQTSIHIVIMTHPNLSPAEMLQKVNQVITVNIKLFNMNKYMTITLFLKDKDGKLYFSGMHQDLVIYKANTKKVETIETRGNRIGYADIDNTFFVDQLELEKGDTLFLFTDRLTEAKKNEEFFDLNGFIQFMEVNGNKSVIEIKEQVLKELSNYEVEDDITFMVLKRK